MGETITTEASALARIDADTGDFIEVTTRTGRDLDADDPVGAVRVHAARHLLASHAVRVIGAEVPA